MSITNAKLVSRRAAAIPKGVGLMNPIFAKRAKNAEVWDVEGTRYIDFAAGIAVVNTGHCHPKIIDAIKTQLEAFTHTCHHVLPYQNYVELAERLNKLLPGDFEKKTCFVTTGAEAIENAIKIARAATGRQAVIAFSGGFHGRTFMGMSLTGKVAPYKAGFGTMMPDIYHVPFPTNLNNVTVEESLNAIESLFKTDLEASHVAAIVIEPIQGEGGFNQAPEALMVGLRNICDDNGILLIADEIQTGFGRTGKYLAMEHYSVAADITCMAKGLAGGMPLAAVTGRADLMDSANPGGLGGTYGGNPLAIASANAVLDVIEDEQLCQRAEWLGEILIKKLSEIKANTPEMIEVRGVGFMVAAEFYTKDGAYPNAEFANQVKNEALKRNLILLTCGVNGNVIRFLAPLTIEKNIFDEALIVLEQSIAATQEYLA